MSVVGSINAAGCHGSGSGPGGVKMLFSSTSTSCGGSVVGISTVHTSLIASSGAVLKISNRLSIGDTSGVFSAGIPS